MLRAVEKKKKQKTRRYPEIQAYYAHSSTKHMFTKLLRLPKCYPRRPCIS
ncbi:hypothetical protein EXN66_Car020899 [Channa argus]|uniref:Uncharacterized protein n=1 Tax=Channa argus TaxID=215402 RepID=A0A6G1QSM0_CHAAH|nr:hypothetical protein EXN66_Car020899 [Channa argus]